MENLFRMLASAADGAFVVNKNHNIVYWNQAAQRMLGYSPNKVVGRPCYEVLRGCNEKGQAVCHHHCRIMTAAMADSPVKDYDVVACTKSGGLRWINISILTASIANEQVSPVIVHLFRDATQARQNQQLVTQMFHAIDEYDTAKTYPLLPTSEKKPHLTKRERQVLILLVQGLSTAEISESLSIAKATVRNHIQSILHSLQVHSRLEAVVYALEHQLVD